MTGLAAVLLPLTAHTIRAEPRTVEKDNKSGEDEQLLPYGRTTEGRICGLDSNIE